MVVIVMGIVGAGKTTIGKMLAGQLKWNFADADDFHPQSNIEKIRNGISLNDEDRVPWLQGLRESIVRWIAADQNVVLACSALKDSYRQELAVSSEVRFVYLKGTASLIGERLRSRRGHFANEQILSGQIADLEEPQDALVIDVADTPERIVKQIRKGLGLE